MSSVTGAWETSGPAACLGSIDPERTSGRQEPLTTSPSDIVMRELAVLQAQRAMQQTRALLPQFFEHALLLSLGLMNGFTRWCSAEPGRDPMQSMRGAWGGGPIDLPIFAPC